MTVLRFEVEDLEGRTGILAASFLREVLGDGLRRWLLGALSVVGYKMAKKLRAESIYGNVSEALAWENFEITLTILSNLACSNLYFCGWLLAIVSCVRFGMRLVGLLILRAV